MTLPIGTKINIACGGDTLFAAGPAIGVSIANIGSRSQSLTTTEGLVVNTTSSGIDIVVPEEMTASTA
jgi:hypothetical protein